MTALRRTLAPDDPASVDLDRLGETLRRGDPGRVRAEAAWQIGRRPPLAPALAPSLVAALEDESGAVRAEAARTLGTLESPPTATLAALVRALDDERQAVRWRAIDSLVALHPEIERGVARDRSRARRRRPLRASRGHLVFAKHRAAGRPGHPRPARGAPPRPGPGGAGGGDADPRGAGRLGRRDPHCPRRHPPRARGRRRASPRRADPGAPRAEGGSLDPGARRGPRRPQRTRPERGRDRPRSNPVTGPRGRGGARPRHPGRGESRPPRGGPRTGAARDAAGGRGRPGGPPGGRRRPGPRGRPPGPRRTALGRPQGASRPPDLGPTRVSASGARPTFPSESPGCRLDPHLPVACPTCWTSARPSGPPSTSGLRCSGSSRSSRRATAPSPESSSSATTRPATSRWRPPAGGARTPGRGIASARASPAGWCRAVGRWSCRE